MRGIVTLATAFALPDGFPASRSDPARARSCVVLGTLVIQGLTLRPLIARMKFDEYDPVAHEVAQARVAAYRAALATLDGDSSDDAKLLRKELSTSAGAGGKRARTARHSRALLIRSDCAASRSRAARHTSCG